ncbi:hypothetical protein PIB30_035333 [Stylosanthes scabra]|uniref:Uncharacterized protein n=1 Tax=Stylosanthes scabra TaxID=79078 RepID=A0ABU6TDU1_9FABA|nr:hypothetical protein [Stylosanthes scabra]
MSQIYRRLDQQQEENRRSFEVINTRMDRMDDQLSFLCYSNQMINDTMYYPYQNTARQFREMETQGVPVTIANLAIHRHREEEMNRERMRHNQTVQEAAAERVREANKGKSSKLGSNPTLYVRRVTSYVGIEAQRRQFNRESTLYVSSPTSYVSGWRPSSHLRQRPHVIRGVGTLYVEPGRSLPVILSLPIQPKSLGINFTH